MIVGFGAYYFALLRQPMLIPNTPKAAAISGKAAGTGTWLGLTIVSIVMLVANTFKLEL